VPIEPAYGIERTIYVVDTIVNPDLIAILGPIFGHGLSRPRSIEYLARRRDPPEIKITSHRLISLQGGELASNSAAETTGKFPTKHARLGRLRPSNAPTTTRRS
jgi:hypothetical protein